MPNLIEIAGRVLLTVEIIGLIAGVVALVVGYEVLRYQEMKKQEGENNA